MPDEDEICKWVTQFEADRLQSESAATALVGINTALKETTEAFAKIAIPESAISAVVFPQIDITAMIWDREDPTGAKREAFRRVYGYVPSLPFEMSAATLGIGPPSPAPDSLELRPARTETLVGTAGLSGAATTSQHLPAPVKASAEQPTVQEHVVGHEKTAERRRLWAESDAHYRSKHKQRLSQSVVAARVGWKDRTIVGWWLRCDPRSSPVHDRKIRSALKSLLN
jgi:hypothetical protein